MESPNQPIETDQSLELAQPDLLEAAKAVLAANQHGDFTKPSPKLYPHQWLWDSCFIAIGLAHYDIERAQKEIFSLIGGQWANGMIPHMILAEDSKYRADREMWRSYVSPYAPNDAHTSGITQPPMLAEAIVRIGQKLSKPERLTWYRKTFPALLNYHFWLYNERDPHNEGLTLQIHPWETGMDNTPPWMAEMYNHQLSWWIRLIGKLRLDIPLTYVRRDTYYVMPGQRLDTMDSLGLFATQRRLRRKQYDIKKALSHSVFAIEDLAFNSILVRANHHLKSIAKAINQKIPDELNESMTKTNAALNSLWDEYTAQFYSRNFVTHELIKIPTIATLLPLYAGTITHERAEQLVNLLKTSRRFKPKFPVPTVPTDSEYFNPERYWQGPTWINMNWLIIDGLRRYKYDELADEITKKTLKLVEDGGFYEYFSPVDGKPEGVDNFSWTAALTIDLLNMHQ